MRERESERARNASSNPPVEIFGIARLFAYLRRHAVQSLNLSKGWVVVFFSLSFLNTVKSFLTFQRTENKMVFFFFAATNMLSLNRLRTVMSYY